MKSPPLVLIVSVFVCFANIVGCENDGRRTSKKPEVGTFKIFKDVEMGCSVRIPESWVPQVEKTDVSYQVGFRTPGEKNLVVALQARYIESLPEDVTTHREWQELQFASSDADIHFMREREVDFGSCIEVQFSKSSEEVATTCHSSYFTNVFENSADLRFWVFYIVSPNESYFEEEEFEEIRQGIRISRFNWQDETSE